MKDSLNKYKYRYYLFMGYLRYQLMKKMTSDILCYNRLQIISWWWNPPLQKIVITQGYPEFLFFHVEFTFDYFVVFLLIVLGLKPLGYAE